MTKWKTTLSQRKGMSIGEAERWLAPNLGYDPEEFESRRRKQAKELERNQSPCTKMG
jgi:hypothetical protein